MKKLILSLKSGIFYTNVTVQLWDRQGQLLVKRESNLPENEALKRTL
ncbi:MAG: hypothetical protein HC784_11400 [Hydrococcus sp. CSU_1_8]|nr:hypothetical protein [Hydrococcus sp. CSU_1_8]